jgi:glucose/arabinose dehydrogenase
MKITRKITPHWTLGIGHLSLRRLALGGIVTSFLCHALLAGAADAPDKKPKSDKPKVKVAMPPRHDPPDIPFRRAPMSNALRSVIIPLATNLHLAFDTELLRTHTVWQGETLNLWGTPYHGGKDRFYCDFNGKVLWTNAPVFAWAVGGDAPPTSLPTTRPPWARFTGTSTKGGQTTLTYELQTGAGKTVRIHETPRLEKGVTGDVVVRRFEISPSPTDLHLLVLTARTGGEYQPLLHSSWRLIEQPNGWIEMSARTDSGAFERDSTFLLIKSERGFDYETWLWREVKNDSETQQVRVNESENRLYLHIQPHDVNIVAEVAVRLHPPTSDPSQVGNRHMFQTGIQPANMAFLTSSAMDLKAVQPPIFPADKSVFTFPSADEFFRVEHFPLPKEIEMRVNGMDFLPNGDLAVCTWTGDIYIVQQPAGDVKAATYRRFARGLCEPCGLRVINGRIYVVQKQELTRITDTDGNGEADLFECVTQDWGYTGNYHDFSYGPLTDKQGNFYVYRTGNRGIYEVPYMGWALKISPDGRKVEGVASGFRSPNGFGEFGPDRDLFMTDNQGNWIAANTLTHVQKGRFYGFPSTTPSPKEDYKGRKTFDPPAVWFPYSMAKSASGMVEITDDRFGPFKGQMLVGDFQNAIVTRVALEKVNGEYQGAVWPFSKGYWSGVNRLAFGPDGKLYVGGLKNGAWAAVAPKDWSLERVTYTGKVPFCVKEVHARPDGFELIFTQPVDPATAGSADSYDVLQYRYEYHQTYGSPEFDHDGKPNSATAIKVAGAKVSADGLKVNLQLSGWKAGHVTMVRGLDVRSAEGKKLWNDTFYYTLNQIPK